MTRHMQEGAIHWAFRTIRSAFLLALVTRVEAAPHVLNERAVTNTSKAGLAWPNGDSVNVNQYTSTGKVSWYYTWSPSPTDASLEFVPMLWGNDQTSQFASTINSTIKNEKVTAVLGMNEPQETGQSNLTPQQGVDLWKQYIQPLKSQGLRLGSPAPSSAPSGKTWLQQFLQLCGDDCTVDFIALHWYDVNSTAFMSYLEDFHNTFNRPLWVTEWACQNFNGGPQCSASDIVSFMNATQGFMDSSDFVERYAWFGAMENMQGVNTKDALMTTKGAINDLGKQYIGEMNSSSSGGLPTVSRASLTRVAPTLLVMWITLNAIMTLSCW